MKKKKKTRKKIPTKNKTKKTQKNKNEKRAKKKRENGKSKTTNHVQVTNDTQGWKVVTKVCVLQGLCIPGTGMEVLEELTEVPRTRTGMEVLQNSQKYRVDTRMLYPYPYPYPYPYQHPGIFTRTYIPVSRVLCHWRTQLSEGPGTDMNVVQNLQKSALRRLGRTRPRQDKAEEATSILASTSL